MDVSNDEIKEAIEGNDLPLVKKLLKAEPALLHQPAPEGVSNKERSQIQRYRPVTYSSVLNHTEILSYLLEQGGDAAEYHNFPLCRAALYDRCVPAIGLLLAHGADANRVGNDYGPPLIFACEGSALDTMAFLLSRGAQITGSGKSLTKTVSWNALKHAAFFNKGCPGMLKLLLDHGADPNSTAADQQGRPELANSALHNAAEKGDVKGVKVLLEYGADPQATNAEGKRPVDLTRNKKVRAALESA